MKTKKLIALITGMIIMTVAFTSCAPKTPTDLESFLKSNKEVMEQIEAEAGEKSMKVDIKGDTVTFSLDISSQTDADEETVKDPVFIESLQSLLEGMGPSIGEFCKDVESKSGLSGIEMVINLTFKDEVIATHTFTSTD